MVLGSIALAVLAVEAALAGLREADRVRFLARVGVAGGALLVAMSLPLGPGVHLSFVPLAGILLGPRGGFLAAFLASGVLSLFGHGGLTAFGANGLFLGSQAVAASALFGLLRGVLAPRASALGAAGTTLLAAGAAAIALLAALPEGNPDGGHAGEGVGWGPVVVAGFALAAAAVETALTASVVDFLSRVRPDLVPGSAGPRPREAEGPA